MGIEETDKKEQVEDKNDNEEDNEEDEEQDDDDEEDGDNEKVDEKDIKESFQPAHLGVPDKYRIDYPDMIEEEEEDDDDIDRKPVSRPRISKKERKLLKKGVDPNTVPQNTQPKKQEQKSKP